MECKVIFNSLYKYNLTCSTILMSRPVLLIDTTKYVVFNSKIVNIDGQTMLETVSIEEQDIQKSYKNPYMVKIIFY